MSKYSRAKFIPVIFLAGALSFLKAESITVLPFLNESGFNGKWNVAVEFQNYLNTYLKDYMTVTESETLSAYIKSKGWRFADLEKDRNIKEMSVSLKSRYYIMGRIKEFYIVKKMFGHGLWGGYKNYNCKIVLKIKVYDGQNNEWSFYFPVEIEKKDRGLRINLPGKISKDEDSFDKLESEHWGSESFKTTILGEMINEACQEIVNQIRVPKKSKNDSVSVLTPSAPRTPQVLFDAKILTVADSTVYLSAGKDDSINVGDHFQVYANGEVIVDPEKGDTLGYTDLLTGQIEILFLKAAHLSSAKITEGKINVGQRARIVR
jgi:hypothetical protein